MPDSDGEYKVLSLRVPIELLDLVDASKARTDRSRNGAMVYLMRLGLEHEKSLEKNP